MKKLIILITSLFLLFQVGHFYEHFAQAFVWLTSFKSNVYMSPWGAYLAEWLGALFFQEDVPAIRNRYGVELLHLFGNIIFLFGIIGLSFFDKSKKTIWGLITQILHVIEHISLTITVVLFGRPLGFSTLFGVSTSVEFLIAYRIWVHFILNLIPSVLIFLVVWKIFKKLKNKLQYNNN